MQLLPRCTVTVHLQSELPIIQFSLCYYTHSHLLHCGKCAITAQGTSNPVVTVLLQPRQLLSCCTCATVPM